MKHLPDYINSHVKLLFVGINPGIRSAIVGHHFAGYSNRFWILLSESNLVPGPLTYQDDWRLPQWGLGLTNIVSRPTAGANALTPKDYQIGRARLARKIRKYKISLIALLGVTLCRVLFPGQRNKDSLAGEKGSFPKLGVQSECFVGARVFVLPNPSGRNAHYSYIEMLKYFKKLTKILRAEEFEQDQARKR